MVQEITTFIIFCALIANVAYLRILRKQKNIDLFVKMFMEISDLQGEYLLYELKHHGKEIKKDEYLSNTLSIKAKMLGVAESFCYLINRKLFKDKKMVDDYIKYNLKEWHKWVKEMGEKKQEWEWGEITTLYNNVYMKKSKLKR